MERLRRQRSQAASYPQASKLTRTVDRRQSSEDKLNYSDKPIRGNCNALRKKFRTPESGSSTCDRTRTTLKNQLAAELVRTSSPSPPGSLMRSLLKDEMLKETESRRRAPSVIAKLMGLDRMTSQNGSGKQPKKSSDIFPGQTVWLGISRHRKYCKNQSWRKAAREQDQFKDVYEVQESLTHRVVGYPSHMPLNRKHTEDEMDFIRQKFMDAKRLSTDQKLQGSKEFHDAVEVLNSNNRIFLKLLEQPDSLIARHLHDFYASQQSHSANVRDLKASKLLNYNIRAIGGLAGKESSQKIDISFSRHMSHMHVPHSENFVTFPAEGKEARRISSTKIVLLKPNLGRSQRTPKSFSSSSPTDLWSDIEKRTTKQKRDRHGEAELLGKKKLPIDLDFSTHRSRASREIAKEITQQMKTRLGEVSFDVFLSEYKGYSADESDNESDMTFLSSKTPYCASIRGKSSPSRFAESSVNEEGKKRLSERWSVTHRSQEIRMEKGTTLGEMLSMPDWDIRSPKLDGAMAEDGSSGRFDTKLKLAGPTQPLGISSKDGWKNASTGSLSRSRSLPNSYHHVKTQKAHMLRTREDPKHNRKKAVSRDLSLKEGSSSESRSLSDNKSDSSHFLSNEMGNDVEEDQGGLNGNKSVLGEKSKSSENKTATLEALTCRLSTILNLDSTMELEHENIHASPNSGDDLVPDVDLSTELQLQDDKSFSRLLHESAPQNHAAEPESPASSKEAEQPSPMSVLEAPFQEDPSSGSECFERVSADLHGLRMQLQLLKLESIAYDEGSLLISTVEEDEVSSGLLEVAKGPTLAEVDGWQGSYTADVLAELEVEEDIAAWNASECPVGPWVFDKLEKKYKSTCSRPERKLLFDRIKDGIMEIAKGTQNPHSWVKKTNGGCRTVPKLRKVFFEGELWKLVENRATCVADAALLSAEQWMDLGIHIDAIGKEIGKMVFDDLIAESVVM